MPQESAFKRYLSTSSLDLIISSFCVALLVQAALAQPPIQPPPLSAAPVNPVFVAWQSQMETFGVETYNEEGYALGYIPSPIDRSHLESQTETALQALSTPVSYDLRSSGDVTGVRDQGDCGSCWSFGSYGSLESWLRRNESQSWDFSENHMKNYHDFDWGPCEGGNADMSTAYLARWSGPVDESDDPYHDWDDRPSPGGPTQKYLKNVLWFFTDSDIKDALMTYGALYVTLRYESGSYNSSEYTYYYSGSDNTNHAVTVVGWDDEKVVTGAPGNGAWLIKNSWGTVWGDNGYFWISYYDTKAVLYGVAFCDAVPISAYTTNYQYDPLGWTIQSGYDSPTAWAANIFTTTADEGLQAVGLYAVDDNVSYEIYVYDDFDGSTFSNLLGSTSGTLVNLGYYTISLPSVISLTNGDDFSIVVKFTTTGYGFPIPTEDYFADYSSGATAHAGESYVSSTGSTFADITDTFPNANVCIRGLTVPPAMTPPVITSIPVTIATVGELYSYDVNASGYPSPTYTLTTYPSGMTIDPNTGLIEWTPGAPGDFDVEVKASNGQAPDTDQGFTITVSEPPLYVDDAANADIDVQGSVDGSYTDAQSSNDGYEAITEVREGNPIKGYSSLEHKWTINVTGGETVTFYVEAYQTASSDGDNFVFAYSTDDSTYTDMLTVSKTSDDDTAQSYELPSSLSGTVYIRVVDTDSGRGNQDMDTLYIDHLYIRSASDSPITYTLTVNIVGSGSVAKDPNQATYHYGDTVQLTANAEPSWTFDSWSEDLTGSTNPESLLVTGNMNVTATFTIEQKTIFGYITEPDANIPVEGVFVDANNGGGSNITDANGYYQLTVDYGWSGTVDPNKTGYTFEPNDKEYNSVTADQNDNYTAILDTFIVSGYAVDSEMLTLLEGVLVSPDNDGGPFTSKYYSGGHDTTDADGYYEVLVDYNWSGKVVPSKYAYAFEPNSITYTDVTEDKEEMQNYVGTLLTYTITGYIENSCEVPIEGVLVDANNGGGQDTTDPNGFYEVWVDYNWSGTVTPTKKHYTFNPNWIPYTNVLEDWIGGDYIATNIYDLDCDGSIGFGDLAVICENWLETGPDVPGDFYKEEEDDIVNFLDFAEFALIWQEQ